MENKQRKRGDNRPQKHPQQVEQNPDNRDRDYKREETDIGRSDRRPGQQTENQRRTGDREAVEGEGEAADESAVS